MSGVAGAAVAAGIAAVATVGGAAIASGASKDAASKQLTAQEKAMLLQEKLARESIEAQQGYGQKAIDAFTNAYNQSRQDLQPFVQSQLAALGQANQLTDPNNPAYQAQRQQMTQQIQRQLAAQGLLRSKNQVDLLSNLELGIEQQRIQQINALAGTGAAQQGAQMGQQFGAGLAGAYQGMGQQVGSTLSGLAGAQSQGITNIGNIMGQQAIQQGQIWGGVATGIGNIAQGTYGNYITQQNQAKQMQLLQGLLAGGGAGGAGFGATTPLS